MLTWLLHRWIDAFEREYAYDAGYLREAASIDAGGTLKFALGALFSQHRARELPPAAFHAAKLASALEEDCGPCAQLGVAMAERAGVSAADLRALIAGAPEAAGPDAVLGFRFARAVLRHDPAADDLREEAAAARERRGAEGVEPSAQVPAPEQA